jgi:hypothetical protein
MLSAHTFMLSVVMLDIVMLNVVAPLLSGVNNSFSIIINKT